jgi:hypothetical protein
VHTERDSNPERSQDAVPVAFVLEGSAHFVPVLATVAGSEGIKDTKR